MHRFILIILFWSLLAHNLCPSYASVSNNEELKSEDGQGKKTKARALRKRIVGGTYASAGDYPWFTMLTHYSWFFELRQGCGGMLVSPEYVLTAAHCINSNMINNGAVKIDAFSDPYTSSNNGGQYLEAFRLQTVTVHPEYSSSTENKDFALLRLDGTSTITPVPLDSSNVSDSYTTGEHDIDDIL